MPHPSDVVLVAILGIVGTVITTVGIVICAAINRDGQRRQRDVAKAAVDVATAADSAITVAADFEALWSDRGRLLDGLGQDLDAAHRRIDETEAREQRCQEALAEHQRRITEIESAVRRRTRRG